MSILNKSFLISIYFFYTIKNFIRASNSDSKNLSPLTFEIMKKYKKSDTVFILGSGSSINKITDREWSLIQSFDSIGFNFWIAHDFLPSIFKFELAYENDRGRNEIFHNICKEKLDDFENMLIIFNHFKSDNTLPSAVKYLLNNYAIYYPKYISIPGRSEEKFKFSLEFHSYVQNTLYQEMIFFNKLSSLIMIISMCLSMDYKNIVLCGVDLNNTNYFFDDDYYQKKYPGINGNQPNDMHLSFDKKINKLTIDTIIKVIDGVFIKNSNKSLYIQSKLSALYPQLPLFNF